MVAISGRFGSFNALLNLRRVQEGQDRSIARLSSGERIQKAVDDASNLAISNNLRAEIKALRELRRTHFDGFTAVQMADDTLEVLSNSLSRVVELATQASSTTFGDDNSQHKLTMNREYQEILNEIDQLNDTVRFNELTLFGSSGAGFTVNASTEVTGTSEEITVTTSSFSTTVLGLAGTDMTTVANTNQVLSTATTAIESISRQRGRLGSIQVRLETNMSSLADQIDNLREMESGIRDMDIAEETVHQTRLQMLSQTNLAVAAQANLSVDRVFQLLG